MRAGQRITELRKEKKLQQKEVAEILGMNRIILNRIELGKRPIHDDELIKFSNFFDVSIIEIFFIISSTAYPSLNIVLYLGSRTKLILTILL